MHQRSAIGAMMFLFSVLFLVSLVNGQTKQTYDISWSVLDEGGNTEEATSASYRLKDAIGQLVIGKCASASYKASIGFWSPKSLWIVGVEEEFCDKDALPKISWVNIRIYNISGQLVKILVDELQEPGQYNIIWNGRDEKGQRVAPGVYFYRFETKDYKNTKKMILLR